MGKEVVAILKKQCYAALMIWALLSTQVSVHAQEGGEEQRDWKQNEVAQTVVHDMVMDFLQAPLPKGKIQKKVLVLGYDGFRRDGLQNVANQKHSAIKEIGKQGKLIWTYAGGEETHLQATSTAPGWTSILTGEWADLHGVQENGDIKPQAIPTFLTQAEQLGYSCAFVASWEGHFTSSYAMDIAQAKVQETNIQYDQMQNDSETLAQILTYVTKTNQKKTKKLDPDVLFFIFEETDHVGHDSGFGNENPEYQTACQNVDAWGYEIIQNIQQRVSYEQEDWLILITTDHGGIQYDHGGHSMEEEATFLISNQS